MIHSVNVFWLFHRARNWARLWGSISLNPHGKHLGLLLSPFTDEETESLNPGHSGSKACAVYLMPLSLSLLPLKCLTCHCSYSFLPMSSLKQQAFVGCMLSAQARAWAQTLWAASFPHFPARWVASVGFCQTPSPSLRVLVGLRVL